MALQQKLSLKLSQRLVMTPSLQQAIKLLQMTRLELQSVLTQELVENPVLEELEEVVENTDEPTAEEASTEAAEEAPADETPEEGESLSDIDIEAYFRDDFESSSGPSTHEYREAPPLENTLTRSPDLYDHLLWQLHMSNVEGWLREIAEMVIGNLNPDGFLVASEDELLGRLHLAEESPADRSLTADEKRPEEAVTETATVAEPTEDPYRAAEPALTAESALTSVWKEDDLDPALLDDAQLAEAAAMVDVDVEGNGFSPEQLAEALALVRSFDPPGVAWNDLRESLLAQLELRGETDESLAYLLVRDHWSQFLRRQFAQIAKSLRVDLQELQPVVELIKTLETRPGRRFNTDRAHYVEPDVSVIKVDDQYVIQLNDDGMPKLRISRAYRNMLQSLKASKQEGDAQAFLKEKMRAAIWLIKSLDQRQRTIYKVADSIVKQQREFLDRGIEAMRPMVLRDVADDIGMHESTVSRVVSNKYIHTPRGLLPMKFFFHSGIDREFGEDISSLTVKKRIRELIDLEDPRKPISDSGLTQALKREGINIARRTVAKYRDELEIASSTARKKIF